ncbi:phosphoribosylformylglycinamidine synthase subunit PurQ, partial [Candidatus Azambacteria bacterium]|nr:phosphoribosylformylglycinamidine synthase subunit PurQ [Candidatus Azambacteria bacterium]
NDLIQGIKKIKDYQISVFPGGFSYGDDLGSGQAYANKVRNHLWEDIENFVSQDKLVIGICNGFQILTNLGLLPGALTFNDGGRYLDRWVDLKIESHSPWLKGLKTISLPIAHGEGKFQADKKIFHDLKISQNIVARYTKGEICTYQDLSANPNGSLDDIAGITAYQGRVLGMMPHPERALLITQLPQFPFLKEKSRRTKKDLPEYGPALQIFKNATNYFKE